MELPNKKDCNLFIRKNYDVKEIYKKEIDCYNKKYDYELDILMRKEI